MKTSNISLCLFTLFLITMINITMPLNSKKNIQPELEISYDTDLKDKLTHFNSKYNIKLNPLGIQKYIVEPIQAMTRTNNIANYNNNNMPDTTVDTNNEQKDNNTLINRIDFKLPSNITKLPLITKPDEIQIKIDENNDNNKYLVENTPDIPSHMIYYDFHINENKDDLTSIDRYPLSFRENKERSENNKYSYHQILKAENEYFSKMNKKYNYNKNLNRNTAYELMRKFKDLNNSKKNITKEKFLRSHVYKNSNSNSNNDTTNIDNKTYMYNQFQSITRTLPIKFTFKKESYIGIKDINARENSIWICADNNVIYKYRNTKDTIKSVNKDDFKCEKITVDCKGLPVVITSDKKLAFLKKINYENYIWLFSNICAVDISCSLYSSVCYYIPCSDTTTDVGSFIMKLDLNGKIISKFASVTPKSMPGYKESINVSNSKSEQTNNAKEKTQTNSSSSNSINSKPPMVFTKIAAGLGKNIDVVYLISKENDLWKYENNFWTFLQSEVKDVTVSDNNDLFYCTKKGVYVWERTQPEPRLIFKGGSKLVSAGKSIMIYTDYNIIYSSVDKIY